LAGGVLFRDKRDVFMKSFPKMVIISVSALVGVATQCTQEEFVQKLYVAADEGRVGEIKALLDPDPVHLGNALGAAARHGHEAIVEFLLPRVVDQAQRGRALYWAVEGAHEGTFNRLLPHVHELEWIAKTLDVALQPVRSKSVAARAVRRRVVGELKKSLLPQAAAVWMIAARKDLGRILEWLSSVGNLITSDNKANAMVAAAQAGHQDTVRLLKRLMGPEARGKALVAAARAGQNQLVELLMDGVDQQWGHDALRVAAEAGHLEIIRILVPWVSHPGARGRALFAAAKAGQIKAFQMLMNLADQAARGMALALALVAKHGDSVRLLRDAGVDINAADADGNTPLHSAVERQDVNDVRIILKAGAKASLPQYNDAVTPLSLAKQLPAPSGGGRHPVLQAFVDYEWWKPLQQ